MTTRLFALLIGIDHYKSGRIWNLDACADDARRMKKWLMEVFHVPSANISLLVNKDATKVAIEDAFMNHLVNNPEISKGDAIIVYFAGHGSSIEAPHDWCKNSPSHVQVLCPYDHDSKTLHGRVAGISDRSLFAMLGELAEVKGSNITLFLDCSFPSFRLGSEKDRHAGRCTPTQKAKKEDLYTGLWRGAIGKEFDGEHGFYQDNCETHVLLAACTPDEITTEWKGGGRFTSIFLELWNSTPLHNVKYKELVERLTKTARPYAQHPVCLGCHKDRVFFNSVPFFPDHNFVRVERHGQGLRLPLGAIHGVMEGTEFTVHAHNIHGSTNPPLDNFRVYEVHPTWSLAESNNMGRSRGGSWARITRRNNRTPFRVYIKKCFKSVLRTLCQFIGCRGGALMPSCLPHAE